MSNTANKHNDCKTQGFVNMTDDLWPTEADEPSGSAQNLKLDKINSTKLNLILKIAENKWWCLNKMSNLLYQFCP